MSDDGDGRKELARITPKRVAVSRAEAERMRAESAGAERPSWSAKRPIIVGILALILLVAGFGSWAGMTEIAGAIVASGRIEVESNRQVVQHPDGGVVEEILVDEGDRVEKGDVLITLDPTLLRSRLTTAEAQLNEILARKARLEAERDAAASIVFPEELMEKSGDAEIAELMKGEARLFRARTESATKSVEQLTGRQAQIERQIEGFDAQQEALKSQLSLIGEELEDQQSLLDRGLAQASRVLALRREQAGLEGRVGELLASAAEAGERISEIEIQILALTTQRREEAITQLRDLQFREVEYRQTVATLREQLDRLDITAPVGGIVYDLAVFAERSVIRPADPLLYIVPQDRPLVITARVPPIHVDQISIGQEAVLRFSTFDARTTPELFGEVRGISADSFVDDATQTAYYRVEVVLQPGEIERLPENLALIPGMPVEAYLRTDDRTPIAYLVKPLADYFNKAFRES